MTANEQVVRVVVVDDQELVRSGLRLILQPHHGVVVVAECSDGDEVAASVTRHRPDVVVMDLRMRRVGGIEATRELSENHGPPVLALTTFDDDELLSGVLRAGAAGFVLKDSPAEELIKAVHAVAAGNGFLDPGVTARVLNAYRRAAPIPSNGTVDTITPREREVLTLIARGLSNGEIASELGISPLTVKTHIGRIFTKLNLRDRASAIVFAYEHRIV